MFLSLVQDLKPSNIFVGNDGFVKIGDFGMSKEFGTPNRKFTPYVCTKQYRAPELFLQTNYYTQKTDIWSLGCIFYYIYKGETLFLPDSNSSVAMMIKIFSLTGTPSVELMLFRKKIGLVIESYQKFIFSNLILKKIQRLRKV